ncbi:PDZ domain-containing protein [Streptomyces rishiriensis]|uniref:PDZ domain-containing protein n=1 Tax=Streptomyces rishiriensis TaxID=68264 RepID=UPI0037D7079D
MEQTALRPKPMPGQESGGCAGPGDRGSRPHAARRRGGRLTTLLFGLFAGAVLVLSGVGLGTVGTTVIGMSRLAELQRQAGQGAREGQAGQGAGSGRTDPSVPSLPSVPSVPSVPSLPSAPSAPSAPAGGSPRSARAALGLEAVDAKNAGAKVVAVHVPGPGSTAGLVRGDVLLRFDGVRIDSATDLARVVDATRPGKAVRLTVRHCSGAYQQLTVTPGVVT